MDAPQYPVAKRYERSYPSSACKPHRLGFDDGRSYIVKLQGNPLGNEVLAKEYVALSIAKAAGYSIPDGGLLNVPAEFLDAAHQLAGLTSGTQFGSAVVSDSHCIYDEFSLNNISNRHELAQVIVLDTLLCNADRHPDNLILVPEASSSRKQMWRYYMIDHSHCFGTSSIGSDEFTEAAGEMKVFENALRFRDSYENETQLDLALMAIESIRDSKIREICNRIPDEWGISNPQRNELGAVIIGRRALVRGIMN